MKGPVNAKTRPRFARPSPTAAKVRRLTIQPKPRTRFDAFAANCLRRVKLARPRSTNTPAHERKQPQTHGKPGTIGIDASQKSLGRQEICTRRIRPPLRVTKSAGCPLESDRFPKKHEFLSRWPARTRLRPPFEPPRQRPALARQLEPTASGSSLVQSNPNRVAALPKKRA